VQQNAGERNFHIFGYLFAGLEANKCTVNLLREPAQHRYDQHYICILYIFDIYFFNPLTARPEKNIIPSQCMGNSQYRRQHYITYHGYKYSLPSVAGFIRQSGDYYLFPPPEISSGQGSERVNSRLSAM